MQAASSGWPTHHQAQALQKLATWLEREILPPDRDHHKDRAMMRPVDPEHITRQAVHVIAATCANSGARSEILVSIAINKATGDAWIDMRVEVPGDPPSEVALTPLQAHELADTLQAVRAAFLDGNDAKW